MPVARFQMPDGRVARFEVPDGTTPEQAQGLIEQHLSQSQPMNGGDQSTGVGFASGVLQTIGKAGRTVAAGVASLPDTALLIPKTIAAGGEYIAEKAGFEGSSIERGLQKIRTTPTMRETVVGAIDQATGGKLQPEGLAENIIMGAGELAVPGRTASKVSQKASNVLKAISGVINPTGSIEAKANQLFPSPVVTKKVKAPTSQEQKKIASRQFENAENLGGQVSPEGANIFIEKMVKAAEPENERTGRVFKNKAIRKLLEDISGEYSNKPMSFDDVRSLDEQLGQEASNYFSKIEGAKPEYGQIKNIQAALRESLEEAADSGYLSGKGFEEQKKAIKSYAEAKRIEEVEDITNKALGQQQPARAIRRGFDRLRNQKGFNRYPKEAQEIINQIADETLTDDVLKTATSRLGAIVSAGAGHPVLSMLLTGLSAVSRRAEAAKELSKVKQLKKSLVGYKDMGPKSLTPMKRGGINILQNLVSRGQQ